MRQSSWRRLGCFVVFVVVGSVVGRAAEDPGKPPGPNSFFVPGYYAPADGRYDRPITDPPNATGLVWNPGFWSPRQPGWTWRPAGWARQGKNWHFRSGAWVPEARTSGTPLVDYRGAPMSPRAPNVPAGAEAEAVIRDAYYRAQANPHALTDAERAAIRADSMSSHSAFAPFPIATAVLGSGGGTSTGGGSIPLMGSTGLVRTLPPQGASLPQSSTPSHAVYLGNTAPGSTYQSYAPTPNSLGNSVYIGHSAPGSSYASYAPSANPMGNSYYVGASAPGSTYGTYLPSAASSIGNYGYGPVAPGIAAGGQVGTHP